eukprot:3542718-Rhodomonas_salina.2
MPSLDASSSENTPPENPPCHTWVVAHADMHSEPHHTKKAQHVTATQDAGAIKAAQEIPHCTCTALMSPRSKTPRRSSSQGATSSGQAVKNSRCSWHPPGAGYKTSHPHQPASTMRCHARSAP